LCSQGCRVPAMPGVDPEMRDWSMYEMLEHNRIVNVELTQMMQSVLDTGRYETDFDAKHDVLPQGEVGASVVAEFQESSEAYLHVVRKFPKLKGVGSMPHPVFGQFDAHKYFCMFGFHLALHRRQAEKICSILKAGR
ncbi:MAG: hypothetical protein AAF226_15585, partial [Verrucomicrobiota bacterium]